MQRSLGEELTAWDVVFGVFEEHATPKLVVAHLRSGQWIGGLFGAESYASGPAIKSKDLVLEAEIDVDAQGSITYGPDGVPLLKGGSLALKWSDVEILTVYPT
jgi:hypothetical protein